MISQRLQLCGGHGVRPGHLDGTGSGEQPIPARRTPYRRCLADA